MIGCTSLFLPAHLVNTLVLWLVEDAMVMKFLEIWWVLFPKKYRLISGILQLCCAGSVAVIQVIKINNLKKQNET